MSDFTDYLARAKAVDLNDKMAFSQMVREGLQLTLREGKGS